MAEAIPTNQTKLCTIAPPNLESAHKKHKDNDWSLYPQKLEVERSTLKSTKDSHKIVD